MTVVPMPHMGVSVEEGTVIEWHKSVGDEVTAGEVICEISTDKNAGETVAVGAPLAELNGDGGAAAPIAEIGARAAAGRDEFGRFDPAAAAEAVTSLPSDEPLASPVAKRVAADCGVELASVAGTGRNGRIRKADVLAAAAAGPSSSGAAAARRTPAGEPAPKGVPTGYEGVRHEVVPTSRVRQAIAEHMIRSRQTAAHMTTEVDVDLTAVVRARKELNAARAESSEAKLSFLPFIGRALLA